MKRAGFAVAVLVALVVAYFSLPAVGTPSPSALNLSLSDGSDGMVFLNDLYPCVPRGGRSFTCEIYDTRGNGLILYSVSLGARCWRARRLAGPYEAGPPMPRRFTGCVSLRDQMRPLEALL